VGKGALCAAPTIYCWIDILNGGHASLCPPYDLPVVIASEAKQSRVAQKDWIASSLRSSQ
jgi:hypothetical protein